MVSNMIVYTSVKLSAYADDVIVLINDQEDVNRLTKIVEDFHLRRLIGQKVQPC